MWCEREGDGDHCKWLGCELHFLLYTGGFLLFVMEADHERWLRVVFFAGRPGSQRIISSHLVCLTFLFSFFLFKLCCFCCCCSFWFVFVLFVSVCHHAQYQLSHTP